MMNYRRASHVDVFPSQITSFVMGCDSYHDQATAVHGADVARHCGAWVELVNCNRMLTIFRLSIKCLLLNLKALHTRV